MADYLIEFGGKIVNKLWTTLFGLELNFFSNVGKTKKNVRIIIIAVDLFRYTVVVVVGERNFFTVEIAQRNSVAFIFPNNQPNVLVYINRLDGDEKWYFYFILL